MTATRPVEARLAGWPYRPYEPASEPRTRTPDATRGIASTPAGSGVPAGDPRQLHERGMEMLLSHDYRGAIERFTAAAEEEPRNAERWTDLAAALIAEAQANDDASALAEAVAAADRALRLRPDAAEAQFNRGLALQLLNLNAAAEKEYTSMRFTEPSDSGWLAEATLRASRLRLKPRSAEWAAEKSRLAAAARSHDERTVEQIAGRFRQEVRRSTELLTMRDWAEAVLRHDAGGAESNLTAAREIAGAMQRIGGDALLAEAVATAERVAADPVRSERLARAYDSYYAGRVAFTRRDVSKCIPLLERARADFEAAGSPMASVAAFYLGSAHFDANEVDQADKEIRELAARLPEKYRALRAEVAWERATISGNRGAVYDEIAHSQEALHGFEQLGEFDSALTMRCAVAGALGRLGRESDEWKMWRVAFREATTSGKPDRMQFALHSAAFAELTSQRWAVARSFFSLGLETPTDDAQVREFYLANRAIAAWRCGDDPQSDVDAAARALGEIADAPLREAASADLALTRAAICEMTDPRQAVALSNQSIAFNEKRGRTLGLPLALLERARAFRALQQTDAAVGDLRRAATLIETSRARITDEDVRDSFLATHEDVFRELIDVLNDRGDDAGAFDAAERLRARMLLERLENRGEAGARPLDASTVREHLDRGTLLLEYVSLPDHTLVFAMTRDGFTVARVPVSRAELHRLAANATEKLQLNDRDAARSTGAALYRLLIDPVARDVAAASSLVVVADDATSSIPFEALYDVTRRKHLIEVASILHAPSASTFARSAPASSAPRAPMRALVIGDPDVTTSPDAIIAALPPLPEARREANEVARIYGVAPLVGREATASRLTSAAGDFDVVHFATHALMCRFDPTQSALALAPAGTASGSLTVRQIAQLTLKRRPVVMLAGCLTSAEADNGGTLRSLSSGFIAAGARAVIGTLWPVPDEGVRNMSVRFHEALARGVSPTEALRAAQLDLISRDPSMTVVWSAFQVSGTTF